MAFSDFDWNDDADEDDRIALKKWLSSDEYFANNSKYPPPKWLQKHTGLKKDDLLDRNALHKWEGKE